MNSILSLSGMIISVVVLSYIAYRGANIIVVAPFAAFFTIVFSGMPILDTYTKTYMSGMVNFINSYWLIFLTGAMLARVLTDSGAAGRIGNAIAGLAEKIPGNTRFLGVVASQAVNFILIYGGVQAFIVAFTLIPIVKSLYQRLNIPWRLYPCVALSGGVITAILMPGSTSALNIIAADKLGTSLIVAPGLSFCMIIVTLALGWTWLYFTIKKIDCTSEGFLETGQAYLNDPPFGNAKDYKSMSLIEALGPSVLMIILVNFTELGIIPGTVISTLAATIMHISKKRIPDLSDCFGGAATAAGNIIIVTASVYGFSTVLTSSSGYDYALSALKSLPGPSIIQMLIAINICTAVSGSGYGGFGIALDNLKDYFISQGIPAEIIHRVGGVTACAFDTLPHNPAVIQSLVLTRIGHKRGYWPYFVNTVAVPFLVSVIFAFLYTLGLFQY